MSKPRIYDSLLLRLPVEVSLAVVSYLSNRDIKSLRLTCTRLSQIAHLRLSRVFLSANTLNIQVFRAVADHERYRHNVAEIIWDDVQLPEDLDRTIITDNYNPPCYEYFREDDLACTTFHSRLRAYPSYSISSVCGISKIVDRLFNDTVKKRILNGITNCHLTYHGTTINILYSNKKP